MLEAFRADGAEPATRTPYAAPGHAGDAAGEPLARSAREHTVTLASRTTPTTPGASTSGESYQPGACNIGPTEIARRRRAGHVGLGATIVLLAGLVATGAPPPSRLLVALPAAAAASGYLQARLRFCAGFGSRGIYNFGEFGKTIEVEDADSRRRDRARATQIGFASGAIGLAVGLFAVVLPP